MRQVTLKQAEGERGKFSITANSIESFLGKPIFVAEELYEKSIPGVTLGLAWTPYGGATLYVEASGIKRNLGGFKQTGQLGKVMQESSEIAYSLVSSRLSSVRDRASFFDSHFIHLHVPSGATPKDGPSAGITMALALYSLAIGKPVRKGLAMTGELTLTGKVLPIGGGFAKKQLPHGVLGFLSLSFQKKIRKTLRTCQIISVKELPLILLIILKKFLR